MYKELDFVGVPLGGAELSVWTDHSLARDEVQGLKEVVVVFRGSQQVAQEGRSGTGKDFFLI